MLQISDTRQRLLNSARSLFYSRSYGHVGVKEICDKAGVQKGSFYHFFRSKEALTVIVLDEYFIDFKDEILLKSFQSDISPMQRIEHLIKNVYQFQKTTKLETGKTLGCPYGNMASELSTQAEPIRKRITQLFEKITDKLKTTLDEAVKLGEIEPIDTAGTALAMFSFIEGLVLMAKTRNDPEIIRQLGGSILGIKVKKQQHNTDEFSHPYSHM